MPESGRVPAWPGMEIEHADEGHARTTGARFEFADDGTISLSARIPESRPIARGVGSRGRWSPIDRDGESATWEGDGLTARVRDDSVLVLTASAAAEVRIDLAFEPVYVGKRLSHWAFFDEQGGLTVHPLDGAHIVVFQRHAEFQVTCRLAPGAEVWISVCPPRRPAPVRLAQSMAHEGRPKPFPDAAYPGTDLIQDAARHCQVFALHAYFWKAAPKAVRPRFGRYAGRRCSWLTEFHEPEFPDRFAALADEVREAGMDLVVYLSPKYSRAADIEAEMERVVATYPVDGLYIDGVAGNLDLRRYDRILRSARRVLGPDRVLYLNATNEPLGSPAVPLPFFDARADFVLRGDSGRAGVPREHFLRYCVSGWNVSNAVGMWCHYGSDGTPLARASGCRPRSRRRRRTGRPRAPVAAEPVGAWRTANLPRFDEPLLPRSSGPRRERERTALA